MASKEYDHETPATEPQPFKEAYEDYGEAEGTNGASSTSSKEDPEHGQQLAKVQSEKPSINNISSVPNGGTLAWLQVVGGFFLMFNSWGIVNTFGIYQTFYESSDSPFHVDSSTISWIGALQACLLMLIGALTGPIYDAGHLRWLLLPGSFLVVFGHMMLSLATEYYQALLAQALCIGLGCGLLFVPSVAIISTYFTTKLALAIGIAASGSSFGGVIYPIVLHRLVAQVGFPWAVRIIGFMVLVTLAVPNIVLKMRVKPGAKRALVDWTAFREAPFVVYTLGSTIGFCGLYVFFFYIQYYSISTGITNDNLGFYLLAILNSASIFGRILPNFIADYTGPLNIITPCAAIAGLLTLCLMATHSLAGIIIQCLFYGFFSGTFVSLPPTVLVTLTKNRALIGTRMGMCFSINSIGLLIGTPIAGAILGSNNNFTGIWIFGGVMALSSAIIMSAARILKTGPKLMAKA
ncbi:hypothetical protein FH972_025671 [Carpinus fangiana]|uniref:Major facilitator superfamily (MFS) profile domain-containing protein n=1 Tax=Carpinus fangiana TaxID=176857 RepID=A0A5N6L1T1_9ROSI|nr:hypothetical protein FH972_025671 [Carpinus fangiana]